MQHASQLRLAMAQINIVVGDIDGNAQKILDWIDQARDADVDMVTFPRIWPRSPHADYEPLQVRAIHDR
jgi:predicted amidohydrolase